MVRPVIGLNHYDNGRPGGTDRVRLLLPFQGCRARESRLDSLTFADFTRVGTLRPDGAASLRLRSGADRLIAKPTGLFGLRYRGLTGTVAGAVRYPLRVPIDRIGHPPRFPMVRSTAVLKRHADEVFSAGRLKEIRGHLPRHLVFGRCAGTVAPAGAAPVFDSQGKVIALPYGGAFGRAAAERASEARRQDPNQRPRDARDQPRAQQAGVVAGHAPVILGEAPRQQSVQRHGCTDVLVRSEGAVLA